MDPNNEVQQLREFQEFLESRAQALVAGQAQLASKAGSNLRANLERSIESALNDRLDEGWTPGYIRHSGVTHPRNPPTERRAGLTRPSRNINTKVKYNNPSDQGGSGDAVNTNVTNTTPSNATRGSKPTIYHPITDTSTLLMPTPTETYPAVVAGQPMTQTKKRARRDSIVATDRPVPRRIAPAPPGSLKQLPLRDGTTLVFNVPKDLRDTELIAIIGPDGVSTDVKRKGEGGDAAC